MKPISWINRILLSALLVCTLHGQSMSQCVAPLASVTYDTLIAGSGNDSHLFTIPKFDATIGTLTAVDVSSVVTVNYGFTLKNTNTVPINFAISVGRNDKFQSTILDSQYSNSIMASVGTYSLDPNQSITKDPFTIINRYDNKLHITNGLSEFIGSQNVNFSYSPRTYTDHSGSSIYQYSARATDTIHFSVTYYYSRTLPIPGLHAFSAVKTDRDAAGLNWAVTNEFGNRVYEIQKSYDQQNFSAIGILSSPGCDSVQNYAFNYLPNKDEHSRLYFRLKITGANSVVSYSTIKMIDFTDYMTGIRLYPNPSNKYINFAFNQPYGNNWRIEIVSASGSVVQTNYFKNAQTAHIDFVRSLSSGIYFARVVNEDQRSARVIGFNVQ